MSHLRSRFEDRHLYVNVPRSCSQKLQYAMNHPSGINAITMDTSSAQHHHEVIPTRILLERINRVKEQRLLQRGERAIDPSATIEKRPPILGHN